MDICVSLNKIRAMFARMYVSGGLLALMLFVPSMAAAVSSNSLESIDFDRLPGDRVQVVMGFSKAAPEPVSFSVSNPARIALDFPDTKNNLKKRSQAIKVSSVQSINTAQAKDRTRAVINLSDMMVYQTEVKDKQLLVTLAPSSTPPAFLVQKTEAVEASPASPNADYEVAASNYSNTEATDADIKAIDFRRGTDGAGRILIKLANPNTPIDIRQQGTQLIVELSNAQLPTHLQRRMDVLDFATPVQMIDAKTIGNKSQIMIKTKGKFSQLAYQAGDTYTVEVRPVSKKKKKLLSKKQISFKGERLSLNFQDIEVRSVLQLIADFTGLNIVVSDDVSGNVTLRLKNVPWDQALDIIMKTKALDKRQHGNVVYIDLAKNIAANEEAVLNRQKTQQSLAPLRTEIISLNYAKAEEVKEVIKSSSTAKFDGSASIRANWKGNSRNASVSRKDKHAFSTSSTILSERGNITVDNRTNTLIVQDTPENLDAIRDLVKVIDVPVRQVLIESRIVTASDKFTHELGASFGASNIERNSDNVLSTNFAVNNLSAAAATGTIGFNLAKIPLGANLDLELSAAETESRVEVVASPRIITSNQATARIEQGVEIPYQEASSSGATSTSFKKAVLSLEVTPQITRDDRINMELLVNRDSVGTIFDGIPSIDTREIQTQVLVENGQTIVLGGIFEESDSKGESRVPFFGELPIIGQLFRRKTNADDKSELLIFVTPKIINDGLALH